MKRDMYIIDLVKWSKWLVMLVFVLLLLYALSYLAPLFQIIQPLIWPILVAILLAYLLHPLVEKAVHLGVNRTLATVLLFLLFLVSMATLLFIGIPIISRQIQEAVQVLPEHLATIKGMVFEFQEQTERLPDPLQDHVTDWSSKMEQFVEASLDQVESVIIKVIQMSILWIVVPFLVFYLLKDFALLQRVGFYITPKKWREKMRLYLKDVDKTFGSYLRGQLLVAVCVGGLSTIALWVLGVPYALLLGLFIGATDLIPYFGAFIGAIPAVGSALLDSPQLALFTAISIFVIQQIEGNVLSPLIVGKTVHLHPILIILALLVGVEVGGVIGLLVAVPITAIAKVTILHIRNYIKGEVEMN
ncbi:AI-2E family transporter [Shouchella sp. 1P09AA]|uniref:AI-2E family transporter n=1 Tax=unclassified Shouchella TaxID=2893065 RepID=UPI0039A03755